MRSTAILVDGGFYTRRTSRLLGDASPNDRADELFRYCMKHLAKSRSELYRIFYYDCHPCQDVPTSSHQRGPRPCGAYQRRVKLGG
jgi:hypothetical protein